MCVKKSEFEELESSDCLCPCADHERGHDRYPGAGRGSHPRSRCPPVETVAVNAPTFYANSHDVKAVVMNIGAAQDSVNVTWYGSTPTGGMLKYGVQGGEMTTLQAAVAPTSSEGWYKNTVTLTGLQSNTTYEYAVSADKDEAHYGETKTYTTQTFGKDEPYTFLVFGDPQIGCSGSIDDDNGGWTNTLNHAPGQSPQCKLLVQHG